MRNAILGGLLGLVLLAWLGWTYFSSGNLETPRYTVLSEHEGYELRRYEAYVVAQVRVEGDFRQALNAGFRRLAGYIFGGNSGSRSMAMTAPVTERQATKIAMTAPVTEREGSGERTIRFMMPSAYTLETLPVPDDPRVEFVEVPAQVRAVSSFSGYATAGRVSRQKEALARRIADTELEARSGPIFATYNDPFSFPLLMKHEIWIEVEDPAAG